MKKVIQIGLLVVLIACIGMQFIPTNKNQDPEILATDFTKVYNVPQNIQSLLEKSCYDCHSNNTKYPWYNNVQPIAWLLEDHINEAKEELNFSDFGSLSKRRKKNKLKSIASELREDKMPLSSYTLIHTDSKLSDKEKEEIITWVEDLVY